MCHSVGVRRISSPPASTTRFAARSIVKSDGDDDRLLLRRRRPPQRGAQPGEQLVHAERLGDEVVGAGIERGDLVGLLLAHREDDDRDLAPAPESLDHLDPVDARQAEVEHDDIGMVARRELEALLARLGQVDVVAAGPQVDAERAPDLRLVVDDEHPAHAAGRRQADDHRDASTRGVLDRELATHRVDEPARDRETQPDAGAVARVVAEPLERLEDRARAGPPGCRARGR